MYLALLVGGYLHLLQLSYPFCVQRFRDSEAERTKKHSRQQIQKTEDTERHPYLFVTCKMDDRRSPVEEIIMTIILLSVWYAPT